VTIVNCYSAAISKSHFRSHMAKQSIL